MACFAKLLDESQESFRINFENSIPALEQLCESLTRARAILEPDSVEAAHRLGHSIDLSLVQVESPNSKAPATPSSPALAQNPPR